MFYEQIAYSAMVISYSLIFITHIQDQKVIKPQQEQTFQGTERYSKTEQYTHCNVKCIIPMNIKEINTNMVLTKYTL